jgi:hypothetical protein
MRRSFQKVPISHVPGGLGISLHPEAHHPGLGKGGDGKSQLAKHPMWKFRRVDKSHS